VRDGLVDRRLTGGSQCETSIPTPRLSWVGGGFSLKEAASPALKPRPTRRWAEVLTTVAKRCRKQSQATLRQDCDPHLVRYEITK
jgi:hypothetical protein